MVQTMFAPDGEYDADQLVILIILLLIFLLLEFRALKTSISV